MSFVFTLSLQTLTFVYFSAERGAPPKHAQNATTITKLKNSKCQNIFRCIFDDSFVRMHLTTFFFFSNSSIWIPEESFDVFTNFFELLLPTKMSLVKRFFILKNFFEFYTAYEYLIFTNCQAKIRFLCTVYFDEFGNFFQNLLKFFHIF